MSISNLITQGFYTNDETELMYYGYRFYSPTHRHWLNRDPIEETADHNLYVFSMNNPICRFDVVGLFEHQSLASNFTQFMSMNIHAQRARGTLWDGSRTIDEAQAEYFGSPNVTFNIWKEKKE